MCEVNSEVAQFKSEKASLGLWLWNKIAAFTVESFVWSTGEKMCQSPSNVKSMVTVFLLWRCFAPWICTEKPGTIVWCGKKKRPHFWSRKVGFTDRIMRQRTHRIFWSSFLLNKVSYCFADLHTVLISPFWLLVASKFEKKTGQRTPVRRQRISILRLVREVEIPLLKYHSINWWIL